MSRSTSSKRIRDRLGQSAIEASILFTFMLLALTIFLLAMGNQYVTIQQEKVKDKLRDVAASIETELQLGASAQNGYYREFVIPSKAGGLDFSIQFFDSTELGTPGNPLNYSEVVLQYTNSSIVFETFIFLPDNVDGNISHGVMRMRKADGRLYLLNASG